MEEKSGVKCSKEDHIKNGYQVEQTHKGQKRKYGDSFEEFTIKSDLPEEEVERYCTEVVRPCRLTTDKYLEDKRYGVKDFGDHFRDNYIFRKVKDGEYFYQVTSPSTH